MLQTLERPEVRDERHGDTLVREPRDVPTDQPSVIERPEIEHHVTRRRPVRWLGWLSLVGLFAILTLVVVLATGDRAGEPTRAFHTADWWEHMLTPAVVMEPVAEFQTADWWEHMLTPAVVMEPVAEFHTADWWERMLTPAADAEVVTTAHSADWWEHVIE
jgi:hypothetical protein